ncbi:hypothetical protein TNCV_1857221 [Trichonephila clavipes]|nr:hypothetical protein TNCV_1857221 [Trichonephila clavipes]
MLENSLTKLTYRLILSSPSHVIEFEEGMLISTNEAREDPMEDPTLKYKAEFYFFTLDKAINALESSRFSVPKYPAFQAITITVLVKCYDFVLDLVNGILVGMGVNLWPSLFLSSRGCEAQHSATKIALCRRANA